MLNVPRSKLAQASTALVALLVGVAVYWVDRQPESVYFMALWGNQGGNVGLGFGGLGNHLPTFLHVYAFIMLTLAVVVPTRDRAIAICALWFVADSLFELGQTGIIAGQIANGVPDWFQGIPFLENTVDYFVHGTFDVIDLYSIALGSLAAFLTFGVSAPRVHKGGSNV